MVTKVSGPHPSLYPHVEKLSPSSRLVKEGTPHPELLSRRGFLGIGVTTAALACLSRIPGLGTSEAMAADIAEAPPETYMRSLDPKGRDPGYSLIAIHLQGGASQRETWDPLPDDADASLRGPFRRIRTSAKGVFISENLPLTAGIMDKAVVIRNLRHNNSGHPSASALMMTGNHEISRSGNGDSFYWDAKKSSPLLEITKQLQRTGAPNSRHYVLQYYEPMVDGNITPFIAPLAGSMHQQTSNVTYSQHVPEVGFLNPFGGQVDERRMSEIISLIRAFEEGSTLPDTPRVTQFVNVREDAISQMTGELRHAFDLFREPDRVRDMYGRNPFGEQFLISRRLIERGVRVAYDSTGHFDHHYNIETHSKRLFPQLDRALFALISDIEARGLPVVVAVFSEFGRTPRINGSQGRDHWPNSNSAFIYKSQGRGGEVIGETRPNGDIVGTPLDASYFGEYLANQIGWATCTMRGSVQTSVRHREVPKNWSELNL